MQSDFQRMISYQVGKKFFEEIQHTASYFVATNGADDSMVAAINNCIGVAYMNRQKEIEEAPVVYKTGLKRSPYHKCWYEGVVSMVTHSARLVDIKDIKK